MSKPTLQEAKELLMMKDQIKKLTKESAKLTRDLIEKHGEGRFDYHCEDPDDDSRQYMKLELTDDLRKLKAGEEVGRFIYTKTESFKVSYLKGKPKGL